MLTYQSIASANALVLRERLRVRREQLIKSIYGATATSKKLSALRVKSQVSVLDALSVTSNKAPAILGSVSKSNMSDYVQDDGASVHSQGLTYSSGTSGTVRTYPGPELEEQPSLMSSVTADISRTSSTLTVDDPPPSNIVPVDPFAPVPVPLPVLSRQASANYDLMMQRAIRQAAAEDMEQMNRMLEIKELHRRREEQLELERQNRLRKVEREKARKEREAALAKQREEVERAERERKKKEFLQKLDVEHLERARAIAKTKAEKRRKAEEEAARTAEERKREAAECRLMRDEEQRVVVNNWATKLALRKKEKGGKREEKGAVEPSTQAPVAPERRPPVPRIAQV